MMSHATTSAPAMAALSTSAEMKVCVDLDVASCWLVVFVDMAAPSPCGARTSFCLVAEEWMYVE